MKLVTVKLSVWIWGASFMMHELSKSYSIKQPGGYNGKKTLFALNYVCFIYFRCWHLCLQCKEGERKLQRKSVNWLIGKADLLSLVSCLMKSIAEPPDTTRRHFFLLYMRCSESQGVCVAHPSLIMPAEYKVHVRRLCTISPQLRTSPSHDLWSCSVNYKVLWGQPTWTGDQPVADHYESTTVHLWTKKNSPLFPVQLFTASAVQIHNALPGFLRCNITYGFSPCLFSPMDIARWQK